MDELINTMTIEKEKEETLTREKKLWRVQKNTFKTYWRK